MLRHDGGGEMESVGAFTPTSNDVELDLPLPGPGDYAAVDVSVEEDGGPPVHSDTSLAGGTFQLAVVVVVLALLLPVVEVRDQQQDPEADEERPDDAEAVGQPVEEHESDQPEHADPDHDPRPA